MQVALEVCCSCVRICQHLLEEVEQQILEEEGLVVERVLLEV